jgi:uncharacterized cupin superfamily protein
MGDYTVKRFEDMHAHPRMGDAFKLARASLGVTSFGMQIISLPPNSGEFYPNHDHLHDGQEEVYVVLGGGGAIAIDGEQSRSRPTWRCASEPAASASCCPARRACAC